MENATVVKILSVTSVCLQSSSPSKEEIGAKTSIRACIFVCTSDRSYLFGNASAIQDKCIQNKKILVADAFQVSHLRKNRIRQSYESKR